MAGYLRLGDVNTWYDEHGEGEPLVLLHPGGADARAFAPNLDALAARFHVFTPERRGHGHTPDVDGPITYQLMASDTIAFLETVAGGPARLLACSDGVPVALLVALRRPELARDLVVVSGVFHRDGWVPETAEVDQGAAALLAVGYGEVSPDGAEHFPVVAMVGDDDQASLEHTIVDADVLLGGIGPAGRRKELAVGPVKSKASKAILSLPSFAVQALRHHRHQQARLRLAGAQPATVWLRWVEPGQPPRPRELDLVFRTERGTALNPNHASRGFARLARGVGLDAHPHMLRHALASAMAANKEPASIIAAQLRHADGGALAQRVYIHQLPQTAPRVAGLIEGVFGPAARDARLASAPRRAEGDPAL